MKTPKPLIVGWLPSKTKIELMMEGRTKELPGYWLYQLQLKYPGKFGHICGWFFGKFYAKKPITTHSRRPHYPTVKANKR